MLGAACCWQNVARKAAVLEYWLPEGPLPVSTTLQARIEPLYVAALESLRQADSLAVAFAVLTAFIEDTMRAVASELIEFAGPQKKQVVLELVGALYDAGSGLVRLPWWLQPVRWLFGREMVLAAADGILEGIYARHKDTFNA